MLVIRRVEIHDTWNGYASTAPHRARFRLAAHPTEFRGVATFRVGYQPLALEKQRIVVPLDLVQQFCVQLSSCPRRRAEYIPTFTHTDDCPELSFRVWSNQGTVVVETRSQGEAHVPWQVRDQRGAAVIETDHPWRAYKTLWKYLKRHRLAGLVRSCAGPK
jgi:hypothetical protein